MQSEARKAWETITVAMEKHADDQHKIVAVLDQLLPGDILEALQSIEVSRWHEVSKSHESGAVIFITIKNLPELVKILTPGELVTVLHTVFGICDRLLNNDILKFDADLTKIETVEGTFVAVAGLSKSKSNKYIFEAYSYATRVVAVLNDLPLAKILGASFGVDDDDDDGVSVVSSVPSIALNDEYHDSVEIENNANSIKLLVSGGVAIGPIITGVVGSFPRFCIFGNSVNAAARMMQLAEPGTVRSYLSDSCSPAAKFVEEATSDSPNTDISLIPLSHDDDDHNRVIKNEMISVSFQVRRLDSVVAKGMGCLNSYVLTSTTKTRVVRLTSESVTSLETVLTRARLTSARATSARLVSATGASVFSKREEMTVIASPSSRLFYATRSPYLLGSIKMIHKWAAIAFCIYFLTIVSAFRVPEILANFVNIASNVISPIVYERYVSTEHSLMASTIVAPLFFMCEVVELVLTRGYYDSSYPEFVLGSGLVVVAAGIPLFYLLYRLPTIHMICVSLFFSVCDAGSMYLWVGQSPMALGRFLMTFLIGMISVMLARSLGTIDYELYSKECVRALTLKQVKELLAKLVPPSAVQMLIDADSADQVTDRAVRRGTANFVESVCPKCIVQDVSPIVAPARSPAKRPGTASSKRSRISRVSTVKYSAYDRAMASNPMAPAQLSLMASSVVTHRSSSRWMYYETVCVFQSDIVNFTSKVLKIDDPRGFFDIMRQLYAMMDECALSTGLWKMYTIGDAYIAVSGFGGTSSSADPVGSLFRFARAILAKIVGFNVMCRERGFPEIALRIGLAAGSAVTAIVGEYRPAYLIWGQAPDRAAQMEHSGVPNRSRIHPSLLAIRSNVAEQCEFKDASDNVVILLKHKVADMTPAGW